MQMITSNAQLLNDLNTLMKGVRKRQELHLALLDYIKKVIANRDDYSMFIEEEIQGHRLFMAELTSKDARIREQEQVLVGRYEGRVRLNQGDLKLVGRLSLRILQICQASYQKLKQYFNFYQDRHHQFHTTVTSLLQNQTPQLDLCQLITLFLGYSRGKYDEDLGSLQIMIGMIERGEKEFVGSVTQEREARRERELQVKRVEQERRRREVQMQAEIQQKREKERMSDRLSRMKEQAKELEKVRKGKARFVDKVFCKMYGLLEPVRQQVMDDVVYACKPDQQIKRLYTEIFERNQLVYNQICRFYSKAEDFKEKIRKFKESMLLAPPKRRDARAVSNNSMNWELRSDLPIYNSTECLTTSSENKHRESALSTDRPIAKQQFLEGNTQASPERTTTNNQPKILTTTVEPDKNQRRSAQLIQRRSSIDQKYLPSCDRLPKINPFFDRNKRNKDRYESVVNKTRRFSDPKNGEINNTSLKIESRVMQVPLIHLNMVEKFEFKVNDQQPKKLPKAFEYTFHFRKRENRLMETRQNFLL